MGFGCRGGGGGGFINQCVDKGGWKSGAKWVQEADCVPHRKARANLV